MNATICFFPHCDSDVVLTGGSDRSVQVFDMNKGAVAAVLPDAHSRAIHCISHNKVSSNEHFFQQLKLFNKHYHLAREVFLNKPH